MHRLCSKISKLKSREIDLIKLLAVKLNDSYALLVITIMVLPLLNYCVIGLLCFELKTELETVVLSLL